VEHGRLHGLALWPSARGAAWPLVADDLRRAIAESGGELTLEGILAALRSGEVTLWLVASEAGRIIGAVVTEEDNSFLNLALARVRYNGGQAFGQVLRFFQDLAAQRGLRCCGWSRRPGMGRLLARHGWKPRFVEYVAP
jgi:hypothetical protein